MKHQARAAAVLATVVVLANMAMAGPASANTTRPFLGNVTLPSGFSGVQVAGVDPEGNLIVWLDGQHEIAKFDREGHPVDFSALGTNVLDGAGSNDCPATPADCDQVSSDGFRGLNNTGLTTTDYIGGHPCDAGTVAAVDSSGGPANGYIYVENNLANQPSQIDVFNSAGEFLGTVNQTTTRPLPAEGEKCSIAVSTTGKLLVAFGFNNSESMYFPVDGNPAHDQFAGQFTFHCRETACLAVLWDYDVSGATTDNLYTDGNYYAVGSRWVKIPMSESHHARTAEPPIPANDTPADLLFGDGGAAYDMIATDPSNQHVFMGGQQGIQEWTDDNQKVGITFGAGEVGEGLMMALDRSGGPEDGRLYVPGIGSNTIAMFGNPIPIPDINNISAESGHTTASVSATVDLAGGPPVTSCILEYGLDTLYGFTKPCSVPTPYTSTTDVTNNLNGLSIGQTYHYRFVVDTANGEAVSEDRTFLPSSVLHVSTDPASNLTTTEADLNGSLDPDGIAPTRYQFEYGLDTDYTESTPLTLAPEGTGVEQLPPLRIEGLQGGKTYHYRLGAINALGVTYGQDRSVVIPTTPTMFGITAANVTDTSADLEAKINDYDSAATYRFEYGTSVQYGETTPQLSLPAGPENQSVTAHIEGLELGVTYHFRLVATNSWGTRASQDSTLNFLPPNCPNSHLRQLTNANYLPDCRGYELVSPEAAGNVTLFPGDVTNGLGAGFFLGDPTFAVESQDKFGLSTGPSRFAFLGGQGAVTGLHPANTLADRYVATRTDHGWVTTYPGRQGNETNMAVRPQCSIKMDRCIDFRPPDQLAFSAEPGETITGSNAPYVWNIDGKFLGRWPTNLETVPNGDQFVGDARPSPDFSHFFFSSRDQSFAPEAIIGTPGSLYDNDTVDATVRVISVLPNGQPIPGEPIDVGDNSGFMRTDAISIDGSHVLFSPPSEPQCGGAGPFGYCPFVKPVHLYMRIDDSVTYDVSGGHLVQLIGMTEDGESVAFSSPDRLVAADHDDSVDIYQWSAKTNTLTIVSQGNSRGDTDACNASWTSACGAVPIEPKQPQLDDRIAPGNGDVYFYSPEQLDSANPGINNQRNLYVFRDGAVHYVTTLDPGTQVDRMQISPGDTHMAFLTRSQITNYGNEGWEEMYRWDPSSGEIQCASCIPSGQPPTISYTEPCFQCITPLKDVEASKSGRFMTDDGRVAFSTADALVPADTNRTIDVYEFTGNRAQLITSGTGDRVRQGGHLFFPGLNVGFEGFNRDGTDLYFSTFESLVPQDKNGNFVKFYDARVNGGFPATPAALPCSAADECHGDSSGPPTAFSLGTGGDLGTGGNTAGSNGGKHRQKPKHAPRKKKHRRHHHG